MSNNITIELCTEDRARVDRLIAALERKTCESCVSTVVEAMKANYEQPTEPDPVREALAEALSKADQAQESPENATGEAEAPTPATTPQEVETPKAEKPAEPVTEKKVTSADIRALYVKLSASGKKEEAKAIILPCASKISDIPADKCQEIYEKLIALEG